MTAIFKNEAKQDQNQQSSSVAALRNLTPGFLSSLDREPSEQEKCQVFGIFIQTWFVTPNVDATIRLR